MICSFRDRDTERLFHRERAMRRMSRSLTTTERRITMPDKLPPVHPGEAEIQELAANGRRAHAGDEHAHAEGAQGERFGGVLAEVAHQKDQAFRQILWECQSTI